MDPDTAPTLTLDLDEDDLLAVEYTLPHVESNLEEQAEAFHERCDEEILAALVAPSF